MPAKIRDIDRMLCGKLKASKNEGGKHTTYSITDGNKVLATTALPRSQREIDDTLLGRIARQQLNISLPQLRKLIQCTLSREEYIGLVRG